MLRRVGLAIWWLVAYERPRGWLDVTLVLALFLLAALGAVALSWPWLSDELSRALAQLLTALATGFDVAIRTVQRALQQVHFGW
jgi:hypothetical protein